MANQEAQTGSNTLKPATNKSRLKIAIDGPAGAGKSTVARKVAEQLGYLYIDTGAMYRAATLIILRNNLPVDDNELAGKALDKSTIELLPPTDGSGGRQRVMVDGVDETENIREREITNQASAVSALPAVRERLVARQRQLAERGGAVLDGRDIGTVVLPNAPVKIFLTASPEVRAKRRQKELAEAGQSVDYQVLLKEMIERDRKDSSRAIAPLRPAADAIMVDTDNMSIDEVVQAIVSQCSKNLNH
jgi:CMP/dCMP kinase